MLIVFKGIESSNIVIFDAEYNEGDLIQFAGIMFKKLEPEIYQISRALNIYVKLPDNIKMNYFIEEFTGITKTFLDEYGETPEKAAEQINNFLDCGSEDLLIVSHGLTNDRITLDNNGINIYDKKINGLCTYNAAKRILKRDKNLTLTEIANEAGMFSSAKHNAFNDAWATVAVFSLLCKLDKEEKENKQII